MNLLLTLIYFTIGVELSNIQGNNPTCALFIASKPFAPMYCVQAVGDGWTINADTGLFEIGWLTDASSQRIYGSADVLVDGVMVHKIKENSCSFNCPDRFSPYMSVYDIPVSPGEHTIQVLKNSDDTQPINLEYLGYYIPDKTVYMPLIRLDQ